MKWSLAISALPPRGWITVIFFCSPSGASRAVIPTIPIRTRPFLPYQPSNAKEGRLVIPEAYGDYYFHAQTGEMFRRPTQNDNGRAMPAMEVLYWENVL